MFDGREVSAVKMGRESYSMRLRKGPFTQAIFVAATQCNFCCAEVATSCNFIAILVQFVSVNVSTRLLLKQKQCAC